MKKRTIAALGLLAIFVCAFVLACGSPDPFAVSGTSERTSDSLEGAPVIQGNTLTVKGVEAYDVKGDMVGTSVSKSTMVAAPPTGRLTLEYDITFTGSIGDKSGTISSHGTGTGQASTQDAGIWTSEETITGGTGDFKGITGTFSGEGHFAPDGSGATWRGMLQYR